MAEESGTLPPPSGYGAVNAATAVPAAARIVDGVRTYQDGEAVPVTALDGVTLSFDANRFTAIIGPSGSGKSTLLHCLAGLDTLTSGKVFLGDTDLGTLDDTGLTLLRRERVGMIFQMFNLIPGLDVRMNITLPLLVARRRPDNEWFDHIITLLGIGDRLRHQPAQLSGGEQQRVAVARALMMRPDLIIADEPTGNLDSHSGADVLGLLRRSVDELGQTVVMVTHDAPAAAVTDRVIALVDGRVTGNVDNPAVDDVVALASAAADRMALKRTGGR